MTRWWIWLSVGVAAAVAGVAWYVGWLVPPAKPLGYAGMEFSVMTPAASARAPLLTTPGAFIYDVDADSPADKAGIHPGEVVASIGGTAITSPEQAAGLVRAYRSGDRVAFTLFDEAAGDIHPTEVTVVFAAAPAMPRHSVRPPRVLAQEYFYAPAMAANAAWSARIARGPTIQPVAMPGLGSGHCNGFAPEDWGVRGHSQDDSMFHVAAVAGFQHALFVSGLLKGQTPQDFVLSAIDANLGGSAVPMAPEEMDFGFTLLKFGIQKGVAGFAEYRITRDDRGRPRIAVWIAAVPSADASWALPRAAAVAFTLHCQSPGAPEPQSFTKALPPTAVSFHCLQGACLESDFAAQYLKVLRLGYVHDRTGATFLIKPRSDYWVNGAEGPGFYHQIPGENEKLDMGRSN